MTTGKPTRRAPSNACSGERAMALIGCFRPMSTSSFWKRSRSSARSMASTVVPRMGIAFLLERVGELQRRLAAELDDDAEQLAVRALDSDQLQHVLGRQRLEVEAVGGVVVGRDGLGVAVDHDRLHADLVEGEGRVAAAVVELDALADAVGAAAEDDGLLPVRRLRLALGGLAEARPVS